MPIQKLQEFLDGHDIKYVVISHSVAYTAQGIAALTHISGKELAKTVIVKIDGELAMALLPASLHIDLAELRSAAGANNVALASEGDFRERFPDCETGAMPPFGNLYDMPVFADESLARDKEIAFNAGSHRELVHKVFTVSSVLGPAEGQRCHARPRLFPLPFSFVLQKFPTGFQPVRLGRK